MAAIKTMRGKGACQGSLWMLVLMTKRGKDAQQGLLRTVALKSLRGKDAWNEHLLETTEKVVLKSMG